MWSSESFYIELLELFPVPRDDRTSRKTFREKSIEVTQCYFFENNQTNIGYCFSSREKVGESFCFRYSRRRRPDMVKDSGADFISIKLLIKL